MRLLGTVSRFFVSFHRFSPPFVCPSASPGIDSGLSDQQPSKDLSEESFLGECMYLLTVPLRTLRRELTNSLADLITIDNDIIIYHVKHRPTRCVMTCANSFLQELNGILVKPLPAGSSLFVRPYPTCLEFADHLSLGIVGHLPFWNSSRPPPP